MALQDPVDPALSSLMPGWREWLFSIKTFVASMLALGIAFSADLDRPYWAMATVYIASQPLSGATRSKAVFRVAGTLLGATAALALVPDLNGSPELLIGAMALWTAACLTVALLDRTPRSYVFLLAAYTAPIIGFPSVGAPEAIWDTAVSRSEEIILGIVCASLVASLVFPRHVGPVLATRIETWLATVEGWVVDVLEGRETRATAGVWRRRATTGAGEIDALAGHLAYDASVQQQAASAVVALQVRMAMLLPLVSSLSDRLAGLREAGGMTAELRAVLARSAAHLRHGSGDGAALRDAVVALQPSLDRGSDWNAILLTGLAMRLREILDARDDCVALHRQLETGGSRDAALVFQPAGGRSGARHRDWGMAAFSGAAAGLAVLLTCLFWIATAWPEGAVAAEMTAVACCFFASLDDPTPGILSFLKWTIVAVVVDATYLFAILPLIHDFAMLVVVLAPAFLLVGVLIARPSTAPAGLALAANGATLMSLQGSYAADFATFANGGLATVVGMAVAACVIGVVRSVGAEWSALRLMRATWGSLAQASGRSSRLDAPGLARLLLDRHAMLVPRLAASTPNSPLHDGDALAELRIGLNIVDLRDARRLLTPPARSAVEGVLAALGRHFRTLSRPALSLQTASRPMSVAPDEILRRIDAAVAVVTASPVGTRRRDTLMGLVGIRRGLFPHAPAYRPTPDPAAGGMATLSHAEAAE